MSWTAGCNVEGVCLLRPLGKGGFGEVWLGREATGQEVAIKRPFGEEGLRVLRQGATAQARISSARGVLPVLHLELDREDPYVVYEYADQGTLRERLAQGPRPEGEVWDLIETLLGALDQAHGRGFLHLDLKPENLLVRRDRFLVTDFGGAPIGSFTGCAHSLLESRSGAPITPVYAAPEVLAGEPADASSDVYATGLLLFEAATGRRLSGVELPSTAVSFGLPTWVDRLFRLLCAPKDRRPTVDGAMEALLRDSGDNEHRLRASAATWRWRERPQNRPQVRWTELGPARGNRPEVA